MLRVKKSTHDKLKKEAKRQSRSLIDTTEMIVKKAVEQQSAA